MTTSAEHSTAKPEIQIDFVDFQATSKYFFETAQYCYNECVRDFKTKDLTIAERDCAKGCVGKQLIIYREMTKKFSNS